MAWYAGDPVVDPAAGASLVSRRFTTPENLTVKVAVMAKYAMDVIFRHLNADKTRVKASLIIPVAIGFYVTPELGPIMVDKNDTLEVINRNAEAAVSGEEVQASMFFDR